MNTVAVLQPGYLPWLGFFDQVARSTVFVYYDDVQFDKEGWRNRNRIKSATGPLWLTVPTLHSGRLAQRIVDVEIDNRRPWAKKHVASISQCYSRAPHTKRYLPQLEELLLQRHESLAELDIAVAALLCEWLGITTRIVRSSQLGIDGGKSSRLVNICRRFEANCYLSGDAAKDYLEVPLFEAEGIQVEWQSYMHPTYEQLHGEFVPYLSTLDLVLNMGPDSLGIIKGQR